MKTDKQLDDVRLTGLTSAHKTGWVVAWALALMTALAMMSLLVLSALYLIKTAGLAAVMAFLPIWIGVLAVIRTVGRYGELVLSHRLIFRALKDLRVALFAKLSGAPLSKTLTSANLQLRFVKDIDVLNEFVLRFVTPILVAVLTSVFALVVLMCFVQENHHATFWLLLAAFMSIGFIMALVIWRNIDSAYDENQQISKRNTSLQHVMPALTQLIIWRKWSAVSQSVMDYDNLFQATYKTAMRSRHLALMVVQWVMAVLLLQLLVWHQNHPVFLLIAVFVLFALSDVLTAVIHEPLALGRALAARQRLNDMMNPAFDALHKDGLPDNFVLQAKQVSVRQPKAVFGASGIDFVLKKSTPLVITGVSGGGKSTLLGVLAGELAVSDGQLTLISGQKTDDWAAYTHSKQGDIGYLGQQVDIFDQSLQDNLRLGKPDATDDELLLVLKQVALDDWLAAQPLGLATKLGEYGQAISGGQARRIALGRLLLTPKKLLLLDEPFAGLDKVNRDLLWQQLKNRQKDGYLVVVSHHKDLDMNGCTVLDIGEPVAIHDKQMISCDK